MCVAKLYYTASMKPNSNVIFWVLTWFSVSDISGHLCRSHSANVEWSSWLMQWCMDHHSNKAEKEDALQHLDGPEFKDFWPFNPGSKPWNILSNTVVFVAIWKEICDCDPDFNIVFVIFKRGTPLYCPPECIFNFQANCLLSDHARQASCWRKENSWPHTRAGGSTGEATPSFGRSKGLQKMKLSIEVINFI